MMTVKELKAMLTNANDDDNVFFFAETTDREDWLVEYQVRIKRVEAVKLTEAEAEDWKRRGF